MSKISRSNFIKGAGVAALAVAAAGMMAGCGSGAPEMVDVHVGYYYKNFVGDVKPIDDAKKYAEVVPVVKGGKVKKSDLIHIGGWYLQLFGTYRKLGNIKSIRTLDGFIVKIADLVSYRDVY